MEYMTDENGGNRKKLIIIGVVALLVIAVAVMAVIIVRRRGSTPVTPAVNANVNTPVVTNTNGTLGPTTEGPLPELAPSELQQPTFEPGFQPKPGEYRALTAAEKAELGLPANQDIWMQSSSPTDGSAPTVTFETKTTFVSRGPDTDNDGLTDDEERSAGTNPNAEDSDGDGMWDKDEVRVKTDPNKKDTDGDGVEDHEEIESTNLPGSALDPCVPNAQSATCRK